MLRKTYRLRQILLVVLTLATFVVIELRLYQVQVRQHESFLANAESQQNRSITLKPRRGQILDRNGRTLATSHFSHTIVINTSLMPTPADDFLQALAAALGRSPEYLRAHWSGRRYFRKVPEEVSAAVQLLLASRKGLHPQFIVFEDESKRVYPNDALAGHIIGFTKPDASGDNIGQAGIEQVWDEHLRGSYRKLSVPVYSWGRSMAPIERAEIEATFGHDVVLTLDAEIQMFTERALRQQVNRMGARGGVAVVLDVKTGAVLALANCPDFNLNDFARHAREAPDTLRNRALTDPIEIGSVMKIFTTAILLDQKLLSVDEIVDGKGGYVQLHGRGIKDVHRIGVVPFTRAFAESSNVVFALLSERLEPEVYHGALTRFGFGRPSGIDLQGEGRGVLRGPEQWTSQSRASLAIGYESSATAIQVAAALAAIGNGGRLLRPRLAAEIRARDGRLVRRFEPEEIGRAVSPQVCQALLDLMSAVVDSEEGTGDEARVAGFSVGGKTGTTVKQLKRDGRNQYYASFAGLLPLSDPRLAIYVYLDEPQNQKYGGRVAAPVFREIAGHALHQLRIAPDRPEEYRLAQAALAAQAASRLEAVPAAPAADPTEPHHPFDGHEAAQEIADGAAGGGRIMPDLAGLTIQDVYRELAELEKDGIEVKIQGSGVVVAQEPAAGQLLRPRHRATVSLALPSDARAVAR